MITDDISTRQEAINPKHSFIVQAPAGSGKTEILSQRYLNLLSYVNSPEEIIALTFTNKAANEMQQRIYQSLANSQALLQPIEPHKQATYKLAKKAINQSDLKNWQILKNPQRLRIMTIDSFCHSLSKQLIFETTEGFDGKISNEPEVLYEQAIYQMVTDIDESSQYYQDFSLLLLHLDNNFKNVKQLLSNMLRSREQWLGILLEHEILFSNNIEQTKLKLESGFHALFTELTQRAKKLLRLQENLSTITKILNFCILQQESSDKKKITFNPDSCSVFWKELIALLFTSNNTFRKNFNAKQGLPTKNPQAAIYSQWLKKYTQKFSKDELMKIYPLIMELRLYERLVFNEKEWNILTAITRIMFLLTQHLKVIFKKKSLLDFNEVSLHALSALGTQEKPTDLMLYLDHQIKHLLIDEFQDTSILQFKLLQMLTIEWQPHDNKTLFIVGDPMQSIYRFRQAEVNLFLKIKERGMNQVKLKFLQLNCNFRSQKIIVEWVNQMFCKIFPINDDINYGGISYAYSHASLPQSQSSDTLSCMLFENTKQESLYISKILKIYLKKNSNHKVAILLRNRNHLQKIIPILKAQNIKLVENEIETFYHQPMVIDLVCICAILTNIEQTVYWISLLQSSLFGFSLNEIYQIKKLSLKNMDVLTSDAGFYQKLKKYLEIHQKKAHERKASHFLTWLENDRFFGVRSTLINRLEIIWAELDGWNIYGSNDLYKTFLNLLEKNLNFDKTDINDFDRFTELLKSKFVNFPSKSNVSVMTIHKSKGLEFDFVIIPQLDKQGKTSNSPIFLHEKVQLSNHEIHLLLSPVKHSWDKSSSTLYKIIQNMQKKRAHYELQRLLYVAVTRAKSKLLLTAVSEDMSNLKIKTNSFLHLLQKVNVPWRILQDKYAINEDNKKSLQNYKLIKQIQNYSISPIPQFTNKDFSLKSNIFNHPNFEEIVLNKKQQIGLAMHQLFNFICLEPKNNISNWYNYFMVCLHQQAISKQWENEALVCAKKSINHTIKYFPWIFHSPGCSEQIMLSLNFGKEQRNIADRIIINNGHYHIIDYKFTAPNKGNDLKTFMKVQKLKYIPQLLNYRNLIASYFKVTKEIVKISLYFPLIPWLQEL